MTIEVDGTAMTLPPTGVRFGTAPIDLARSGRISIRCVSGTIDLDRMDHD